MFLKAGFLALVSGVVLLFAQPALADGSQTYSDATGENAAAADISAVTVANDDAGMLTFGISFTNMPDLAADTFVALGLDTDRNARTGDRDGAEYVFVLDGSDRTYGLLKANGSSYDTVPGELDVRFGGGIATVKIDRATLGGIASFDFFAFSGKGPQDAAVFDDAPEANQVWTYELKFTPVIEAVVARYQPAQPRAGKAFALPGIQVRLGDDTVVVPTSVKCTAKLAGKALKGTGPGGCRWSLPKNAKGKRLVVTVTATYANAKPVTASSSFTVK